MLKKGKKIVVSSILILAMIFGIQVDVGAAASSEYEAGDLTYCKWSYLEEEPVSHLNLGGKYFWMDVTEGESEGRLYCADTEEGEGVLLKKCSSSKKTYLNEYILSNGKYVYYAYFNTKSGYVNIYRCKTDGTGQKKIKSFKNKEYLDVQILSIYDGELYLYCESMFTGGSVLRRINLKTGKMTTCGNTTFMLRHSTGKRYIYGDAYLKNDFKTVAYDCNTGKMNKFSGTPESMTTIKGKLYYTKDGKKNGERVTRVYRSALSGKGEQEVIAILPLSYDHIITTDKVYYKVYNVDDEIGEEEVMYYLYSFAESTSTSVDEQAYKEAR